MSASRKRKSIKLASVLKADLKGFTLTELLIASLLTLSVISLGGAAITNLMALGNESNSATERRIELNRALSFMATEIRHAAKIEPDTFGIPAEFTASLPNADIDRSKIEPVFALSHSSLPTPLIYYLATPTDNQQVWAGPKVIYRWGPPLDENGNYGIDLANPDKWVHQPLIDGIENTPSTANCEFADWTLTPAVRSGFYACIDPNGRIAQLYQTGRIKKAFGTTTPYLVEARAFTHSSSIGFDKSGDGSLVIPWDQPIDPKTPPGTPGNKNMTFEVLGSDIRCGQTGDPMNVTGAIRVVRPDKSEILHPFTFTPGNATRTFKDLNQPAGTVVNFSGRVPARDEPGNNNPNNKCEAEKVSGDGFSSLTDLTQVKVLKDGETAPAYAGFGGALSIKDYLKGYRDETGKPIELVDQNGVIHLPNPDKQAIVLFELGVTDTQSSAYDLQDLVILATLEPV